MPLIEGNTNTHIVHIVKSIFFIFYFAQNCVVAFTALELCIYMALVQSVIVTVYNTHTHTNFLSIIYNRLIGTIRFRLLHLQINLPKLQIQIRRWATITMAHNTNNHLFLLIAMLWCCGPAKPIRIACVRTRNSIEKLPDIRPSSERRPFQTPATAAWSSQRNYCISFVLSDLREIFFCCFDLRSCRLISTMCVCVCVAVDPLSMSFTISRIGLFCASYLFRPSFDVCNRIPPCTR